MPMTIADIGLALMGSQQLTDTSTDALFTELSGSALDWDLLQIAPGREWDSAPSGHERWVLVLDGVATFRAGGHRHSAGTGQVEHVGGETELTVHNDDRDVLRAVLLTATRTGSTPAHDTSD